MLLVPADVLAPRRPDEHFAGKRVASRFRELRDDDFTGGFVLRRFEHFTSAEVRTWWINGTCALTTAHPDTPEDHPPGTFSPGPAAALIDRLGAAVRDRRLRPARRRRLAARRSWRRAGQRPARPHPTGGADRRAPGQQPVNRTAPEFPEAPLVAFAGPGRRIILRVPGWLAWGWRGFSV